MLGRVETLTGNAAIKRTRQDGHGGERKALASAEYRSGHVGFIMRGTRGLQRIK